MRIYVSLRHDERAAARTRRSVDATVLRYAFSFTRSPRGFEAAYFPSPSPSNARRAIFRRLDTLSSGFFDLMSATSASESAANSSTVRTPSPPSAATEPGPTPFKPPIEEDADREAPVEDESEAGVEVGVEVEARFEVESAARLAGDDRPNARPRAAASFPLGTLTRTRRRRTGTPRDAPVPGDAVPAPAVPAADRLATLAARGFDSEADPEDPRDAVEDEPPPGVDAVEDEPPPPPPPAFRPLAGLYPFLPPPDSRFMPYGATSFLGPSANPIVAPGLDRSLSPNLVFRSFTSSSSDASAPSTTTPPVRFTRMFPPSDFTRATNASIPPRPTSSAMSSNSESTSASDMDADADVPVDDETPPTVEDEPSRRAAAARISGEPGASSPSVRRDMSTPPGTTVASLRVRPASRYRRCARYSAFSSRRRSSRHSNQGTRSTYEARGEERGRVRDDETTLKKSEFFNEKYVNLLTSISSTLLAYTVAQS